MNMEEEHELGFFERYLTVWVGICIVIALFLGQYDEDLMGFELTAAFEAFEVAGYSIPIVIVLFLMIYPIMVQTPFQKVIKAGKTAKPILTTLALNWGVKPFLKAGLSWLFFAVIFAPILRPEIGQEGIGYLIGGMILLGIAPCTAMVLVWSYLSRGNMGHTIVVTAINSLSMLVLYAPLALVLLPIAGATGADIGIPAGQIGFGVLAYIGLPLVAGYFTRNSLIKRRGREWFDQFTDKLHYVSIAALLFTIIVIVSPHSERILDQPLIVLIIAIPLIVQFIMMFIISYWTAKKVGLAYEDAAPTAQIATSNHFELAIAMSITVFGMESLATLAAVTGLLIEVPVMLIIVQICLKTRHWFPSKKEQSSRKSAPARS